MTWDETKTTDWLLREGRLLPDLNALVDGLGDQLAASGAPVWRVRYSMRTVHPLVTAVSAIWESDSAPIPQTDSSHGLEQRSGYMGSPILQILNSKEPLRKKLGALTKEDHAVFHELKARGATDYYGLHCRFNTGSNGVMMFVTKSAQGFDAADLDRLQTVAQVLAPIAEVFSLKSLASAIATTYLGARTGARVLNGQIRRGDIETLDAAILISDMRNWTALNARLSSQDVVQLANRYFDHLAQEIHRNGGEILKFMGDGVLAVFPVDMAGAESSVCNNALAAARACLETRTDANLPEFGFGLHFGSVEYGNIGAAARLDFTVLGQAVNLAARIEALCAELGAPILFSKPFAELITHECTVATRRELKGISGEREIYRPV